MIRNPNKEFVEQILFAIKENDGYCPCVVQRSEDTKCPCKEFREYKRCHCGLYIEEVEG